MHVLCYCGYKIDEKDLDNAVDMNGEHICRYCQEAENDKRETRPEV